ncbi:xylulokinase [Ruegeria halocynthiae]|uniref:Xylulokinase n=1 Tax=Ruegeria halocynthiae TaxID=985054 RepID=A0A1H3EJP3_9RHOB|nr:FGGY-family carbohydrate kinase [Ruegeria halocynthiae]SDX79003.1 xylulokinase [Ruegeria halocynthiae]
MGDIFLGLDLGTSSCKLIAFDATGQLLSGAVRSYGALNPQKGFHEIDANDVWHKAVECFAELRTTELPGHVRTLAISVLGEAMVPLDTDGVVLAPAQLSSDMRCTKDVTRLDAEIGGQGIYARTGQPLSPIYTLPKLMWWRRHRPELLDDAAYLLCFGEFALMRLGLPPVIDRSMAARTLLYDIRTGDWSDELLAYCGLHRERLARIGQSGDVIGQVPDAVAKTLSLPSGVTVVLGGHDQPMGALGAGVVAPGTAMYSIGTTEALVVSVPGPSADFAKANIPCSAHIVPGQYAALAGTQSGGRCLDWYRNSIGAADKGSAIAEIGDMLASLPDERARWPITLPHLLGSGSVLNDHQSLGAIYGLRMNTSQSDLLLSLLEGITFEQALNLEALEMTGRVQNLRAVGGGARSSLWLQMKADILNRKITRVAIEDSPCLAGAILGRACIEQQDVVAVAQDMIRDDATFIPRPERHELHAVRLEVYRDLYTALKPLSQKVDFQ